METNLCRVCRNRKPLTEFYKHSSYTNGYSTRCKSCELEYDRKRMESCIPIIEGMKRCSFCKLDKPVKEYSKRLRSKDGLRNRCKQCDRQEEKKYRLKNQKIERYALVRLKYGLERDDYDNMHIKQEYKCAICKEITKLVVDHNHTTGNVRGLLCSKCNAGLGMFMDSIDMLNNAIKYLQDTK